MLASAARRRATGGLRSEVHAPVVRGGRGQGSAGAAALSVSPRLFRRCERAAARRSAAPSVAAHSPPRARRCRLRRRRGKENDVKPRFTRGQRMTIVSGVLCIVLLLVVLQLWLLTATMNAFLGGDDGVVLPAALASVVCFLLNAGLLWHLYRMER